MDEALSNGDAKAADDIRYERYCNNKKNEGINPECREEWDKLNERIKNNRSLGYKNEPIGRESLRDYLGKNENELINNNNSGNMYTNTMDGKTVRPDSIGVNNEGNIEIVHDHKHFTSKNDQEIFNDAQMRAERDMIEAPNGKHIVTMSSDFPDLNGIPPKPRPSGPLAERSDIYYTDTSCGKITHKWDSSSESWVKLIDFRRDY
ncbi:ADP-ribosyltransferase [Clostridium botulinum]|nr:ADP-ribosyltransferase [Clostridium botulinum]